jgi:hypothetical protein
MLININKKPIKIEEEPEQKPISIPYLITASTGILLCLWIMDLVCYTFFYIHPFGFTLFITKLFAWIGGL